jgi:integrase
MTLTLPSVEVIFDPLRESKFPQAKAIEEYRAWMDWLDVGQRSDSTQKEYGWIADRLLKAFPDRAFEEFSDMDLLAVLRDIPAGSLDARVAGLRSWFKWGIKTRRRIDNPCDLLPDFKKPKRKIPVVYSRTEERALEGLPAPRGQLLTVLFETGLRRAEACHIRSRSFNLDTRELTVREYTKGGNERVVGISQRLVQAIEALRILEGLNPNDYLWPTNPGGTKLNRHDRPKTVSAMERWWKECCRDADVPTRKLHTTRHTYATRWRERGLPLEDLQAMLGHASPETTLMYAHTKVRDIVRRMDALPEETD